MVRSKTSGTVFLLAWLLLVAPIFAQMGYPLKGSWSGDWWLKKGEENHLLLDFDWDGKTLTGVLNPGTDNVVLQKLSLEPPTGGVEGAIDPWNLHFEADVKDTSGRTVHYVVDGKLQNIGAYRKFVTGTWMAGNQKGEFRIVRN
ncbi:MAG: hypothetical protein DMG15_14510 [Acidobacteria bacterium]|nr:MAG: hypothetical protein DMG15_14510 [Acidobacteriota bacterium]